MDINIRKLILEMVLTIIIKIINLNNSHISTSIKLKGFNFPSYYLFFNYL